MDTLFSEAVINGSGPPPGPPPGPQAGPPSGSPLGQPPGTQPNRGILEAKNTWIVLTALRDV